MSLDRSHPFFGPRSKIERARQQLGEIDRQSTKYLKELKCSIAERIPRTEPRILDFVARTPVPEPILHLTAELGYHLRSSLDQMLVAIAHANGVNDTGNIHFPFVTEERELDEKGVRNKLRGLPVDVKALVRACNPYRNGGDQDLWGLGALANIDKHNMLIPYGPVGAGTNFIGIQVLGGTLVGGNVGDLLEGVTFCKLYGAGTLSHGIIEISADVSFGRTVEIFAFQEAVPVLEKLIQLVESIVETFAAHCFGK